MTWPEAKSIAIEKLLGFTGSREDRVVYCSRRETLSRISELPTPTPATPPTENILWFLTEGNS